MPGLGVQIQGDIQNEEQESGWVDFPTWDMVNRLARSVRGRAILEVMSREEGLLKQI